MSEISNLTIKIPLALKDKLKAVALEAQHTLSEEVCQRLEESFQLREQIDVHKEHKKQQKAVSEEIDNQNTEEDVIEAPLTPKELKKLRQLLKNTGKKK